MNLTDDISAWHAYPQHRQWFNKLWLSEQLGYSCGPGGVAVPQNGTYIIRPVYNLRGMGLGAELKYLTTKDLHSVPAGYFWCEQFQGIQRSIDYCWNAGWKQVQAFEGHNQQHQLYRFTSWKRCDNYYSPKLPYLFNSLQNCEHINIEFIDNKIIEVHLRGSPDPKDYQHLIPVWSDETIQVPNGYTWISSPDGADGLLPQTRLGFYAQ